MDHDSALPPPSISPTLDERSQRFVCLFAQYEHQIYAFIAALSSSMHEADEVMQETSLALWKMFDQFEEGTNFSAWAVRVAHFRVLRYREKCGRDRHVFSNDLVEAMADTALEEIDLLKPRRYALAACVAELRPADQQVLTACYTGGKTIKDAAEMLQRPAKGVYKSLARIRSTLMECVRRKLAIEERGV